MLVFDRACVCVCERACGCLRVCVCVLVCVHAGVLALVCVYGC